MVCSPSEYALMFKALSDETRLRIFHMLSHEELCACRILEEVSITQPTLSYHMKLLCGCGLVDSRKAGSWIHYTVNAQRLCLLQEFLQQAAAPKSNDDSMTGGKSGGDHHKKGLFYEKLDA